MCSEVGFVQGEKKLLSLVEQLVFLGHNCCDGYITYMCIKFIEKIKVEKLLFQQFVGMYVAEKSYQNHHRLRQRK